MKIEQLRDRRPRQYVFRQAVSMKKSLGWVLRTWAFDPADHSEPTPVPPEESRNRLAELHLYMEEIERIAGEVKEFALERLRETDAEQ